MIQTILMLGIVMVLLIGGCDTNPTEMRVQITFDLTEDGYLNATQVQVSKVGDILIQSEVKE